MSGSQSDTPQKTGDLKQNQLQNPLRSLGIMDIFKPFPVRQVFLLLNPPGVQFSGETPGKAALKVQASRIGSLTAETENGRWSLAQFKLQSVQHIPSNDLGMSENGVYPQL